MQMADEIFQLIRFRKWSKQMGEAERAKLQARIARYSILSYGVARDKHIPRCARSVVESREPGNRHGVQ
jgi:hypothetical protein